MYGLCTRNRVHRIPDSVSEPDTAGGHISPVAKVASYLTYKSQPNPLQRQHKYRYRHKRDICAGCQERRVPTFAL
jgi:hypothetical protein